MKNRRTKKLAFFACGLLMGHVGIAKAMWTEDANGNTIRVTTSTAKQETQAKRKNNTAPKTIKVSNHASHLVRKSNNFAQINLKDIEVYAPRITGQTPEDVACLAYSIFREAGTLPAKDQAAVGQVHINRLRTGTWGKHLCQVVYAKSQFSWTLEKKLVRWTEQQKYVSETIARAFINGLRVHPLDSDEILHYHATYVHPKWGRQGQVVAAAGPHIFYKDVPY